MTRVNPADRLPGGILCSMNRIRTAFNTELALTAEGNAPAWLPLLPPASLNGTITGRDGRTWVWDDKAQRDVLNRFAQNQLDIPLDWEHATQHRAANGEDAPAAGWIDTLKIEGGALMGRVQWTPRGREQVQNREYRFISPVFDYSADSQRIARMVSAGLTNRPNLHLPALNQEGSLSPDEDTKMPRSAELAAGIAVLGLNPDADDAAIETAINTLKQEHDGALKTAANSQIPNLERYIPRADYDAVLARASNAEQTLRALNEATHKAAVDAAIAGAIEAGKIAPVSEGYYRAQCREADGLKQFQEFISAAPVIAGASGLDNKKPASTETAINSEQTANKARAYMAEQKKAGIEVNYTTAVNHILKEGEA